MGAPGSDRHAIPLVESVNLHAVAGIGERVNRELIRLAFDLLHCQYVQIPPRAALDDAVDAGTG